MIALAADVGGTKVAVAVVTEDGGVIAKAQQPTDLSGPDAVVEQIAALSARLLDSRPPDAAGVCVPAVLERGSDRVLWAPNLPGWENADVKAALERRLNAPVTLEYDGHAAALGEFWVGPGRGYRHLASIVIGTGIGAGFIIDGQLWAGRDRLAGAIGWFPIYGPDGLEHWEQLASGPAIAQRAMNLIAAGRPTALDGRVLNAKDVFHAARQGDALACQVIDEAAEWIGQGVSAVISFANPQIVVLGGSIGQQGDLLLPTVQRTARRWAQPYAARDLPIVCSALGEEANLLGAAFAAFQRIDA